MSTTIRVQMKNNSDARKIGSTGKLVWMSAKHNGGKTVIVTVDDSQLDKAVGLLDESHLVASYEVQS